MVPVNKLALLNMPNNVDRNAIAIVLAAAGYLPQDIRVINRRGGSRSFGFIDFADVKTATKWMDENQGWLTLQDGRRVQVEYAKSDPASGGRRTDHDWTCANCSVQNFFKRDACFKCDTEKGASLKLERQGLHMVGVVPCDTLLIRSLPEGCTTAMLFESLSQYTALTSIVQLQISDSKQYAYIQMKSSDEATLLLNSSYKSPIRIGGQDVMLTFCRHSMTHLIRQQISMLQSRNPPPQPSALGMNPNAHGAEVAQAAMAALRHSQTQVMPPNIAVPPQHMILMQQQQQQLQQQQQQGQPQMMMPGPQQGFNMGPQQAASMEAPYGVVSQAPVNGIIGMTPTPRGVFAKYVTPNPATFSYDQNVGYYVDPETKFYFDQKTGYYFNNDTRKWCTWDATYSTYFPIEDTSTAEKTSNAGATNGPAEQTAEEKKSEEKAEEAKQKSAKDIANEMLKWAKKQEKATKVQMSLKPLVKPLETKSAFDSSHGAAANVAHKMLEKSHKALSNVSDSEDDEDGSGDEKKRGDAEDAPVQPRRHVPTAQEHREMMERALVDEGKKMCLLCKRAFPSVDVLRKHVEKSELHKKNLEEKRVEWGRQYVSAMMEKEGDEAAVDALAQAAPPAPAEQKIVYRDRAKERRQQFGLDPGVVTRDEIVGTRSEEALRRESEAASLRPLGEDNIGSKLLKGMGWREGQGVGRNGQGIVNPIEPQRRVEGAGLGAIGSRVMHGAEATHQERVRATFFSRYKDLT